MQAYEISLDMRKAVGRIERTVVVRRGDDGTQLIRAAITAGGEAYAPKGAARLDVMHADGTWARCSASVSGSTVSCVLTSQALNGIGRCRAAHFVFADGGKIESTEGFALVIEGNVDVNGTPGAQAFEDELEAIKASWREFSAKAERDEAARAEAEGSRRAGESERASAEGGRAKAEDARAEAERARDAAESARAAAEAKRAQSESARAQAEAARASAEGVRASAETARAAAEAERAQAERARVQSQAKNDADQALNNEQVRKLTPVILAGGQYDPETLEPTIEGEPNRMYLVPMVAPAAIELYGLTEREVQAGNSYAEWMWVGGRWELMGQTEMQARPISTAQIDAVFAGGHPTGGEVLSLTGLDYAHGKGAALLGAKSDKGHGHAVADVAGLRGELGGKLGRSEDAARAVTIKDAGDGRSLYVNYSAADVSKMDYLPVWTGGKLMSVAKRDGARELFAAAGAGASAPSDDEVVLCSQADGATPVRRRWSAVWEYVRSKASGVFAAKSHAHAMSDVEGLGEALRDAGGVAVLKGVADLDGATRTAVAICADGCAHVPDRWSNPGRTFALCLSDGSTVLQVAFNAKASLNAMKRSNEGGAWSDWTML